MLGLIRGGNRRRASEQARVEFMQLEAQLRDHLRTMSTEDIKALTRAIGQATRVIMAKLDQMEKKMAVQIDDLLGAVEAQRSRIESLITLTVSLHNKVKAALPGLTPEQEDKLSQLFETVKASTEQIDAAIVANTDTGAKEAAAGAVTGGPSAADIKNEVKDSSSTEAQSSGS